MKNLSKLAFSTAAAVLFGLGSCNRDFRDAELAEHVSDFAFPLFTTDLFFSDLIANVQDAASLKDTLIFNADKTMTLIYSGDVAEKPASELYKFSPLSGLIPLNDSFFVVPYKIGDLDGVSIRRVILKKGTIKNFYAWNNGQTDTATVTFKIPQMVKNGVPFTKTFKVPGAPVGTLPPGYYDLTTAYDVSGYTLTSNNNQLYMTYDARLPNGTRIKLQGFNPLADMTVAFQDDIAFSYLEGFWGNRVYSLDRDSIDIDINSTNLKGNITIKDPKVTCTVANSYGFPTQGKIKYLRFIGKDGQPRELISQNLVDGIDFAYPSLLQVGQTKHSSFTFDSKNSNIAEVFNSQPTQMIYEIDGVANAKNDSTLVGFLTDMSTVKFGVTVELTLEGSAQDFGADQKIDLDFGDLGGNNTEGIDSVVFKLVTENKMPVSTALQVYFQDAAGATLDSLFVGGVTQISTAAQVDANGFPMGMERSETFVPMSKARFDVVRTAKQAFLKTLFSTTLDANGKAKTVKLLSDNSTKVKMGLRVKIKN